MFLSGEVEPNTPHLLLKGHLFIMCNPAFTRRAIRRSAEKRLSATSTSSRKANSAKLADLVPIQSRSQQANRHRSCSGKANLGKQCFHHFSEWSLINPRPSLAPRFRSQASVQPHATPPVSLRPANLLLNTAEWGREKQISSRGHTSPG